MTFDYDNWLKAARDRLELLYQQKASIEEEISKLESGIEGFIPLTKQGLSFLGPEMGMTQAIRTILKSDSSRIRSATEFRDALVAKGVQLTQNNPMATIHQILARLYDQGDAKTHIIRGKTCYQWSDEGERRRAARRKVRFPAATSSPPEIGLRVASAPSPMPLTPPVDAKPTVPSASHPPGLLLNSRLKHKVKFNRGSTEPLPIPRDVEKK